MARPETHDDLPAWNREPRRVLTLDDPDTLTQIPGATAAYWRLVDLLRDTDEDFTVTGTDVTRPQTDDELDARLSTAQAIWDHGRNAYIKFDETGERPQFDGAMQAYCKAEGIDVA